MENYLLCDEVWLSNPGASSADCCTHEPKQCVLESCTVGDSFYTTKEDCERAKIICLEKELSYMPQPGYVEYLQSNNLMHLRHKAIQWLIKSGCRLNLSFGTVFSAANYLDRFISMNHCDHEWKCWMVELLSVACLAVAIKFAETSAPLLQEIQVDELEYSFQSSTIRRMELTLLQTLGWRLSCITPYSYVELLLSDVESLHSHTHLHSSELPNRLIKLLLEAILDVRLLEYRPSLVAVAALWCSLDELIPSCSHLANYTTTRLFDEDQKDDVVRCHMIMKSRSEDPLSNLIVHGQPHNWPSSPVTVLLKERIDIYDFQVDLSVFKIPAGFNINVQSCKKRRKEEQ